MPYRRSIFLINRPFQIRFSFYVCSWLFALSLVYPLIIYNLFDFFMRHLMAEPNGPAVATLVGTRQQVIWLLVAFQVVFLAVTFLISLFVSHRIAGPLYKLSRFFENAKKGDLSSTVQFRKRDHFQDLAKDFNEMIEALRNIARGNSEKLSDTIAQLEKVAQGSSNEDLRKQINTAVVSLREVRDRIPKQQ